MTSRPAASEVAINDLTGPVLGTVGVEQLSEIMKAVGYRVCVAEQNGLRQLISASRGVGFTVRFGNAAELEDQYLDYTLSCTLQMQGELAPEIVLAWNRTKRFARLWTQGRYVALEMDVVVAGGVTAHHLRSQIELWDRLVQDFRMHLRNRPMPAAAMAIVPDSRRRASWTDMECSPTTLQ